jgi:hypothetical protein
MSASQERPCFGQSVTNLRRNCDPDSNRHLERQTSRGLKFCEPPLLVGSYLNPSLYHSPTLDVILSHLHLPVVKLPHRTSKWPPVSLPQSFIYLSTSYLHVLRVTPSTRAGDHNDSPSFAVFQQLY